MFLWRDLGDAVAAAAPSVWRRHRSAPSAAAEEAPVPRILQRTSRSTAAWGLPTLVLCLRRVVVWRPQPWLCLGLLCQVDRARTCQRSARARVYTGTSLVLRCTVDASTARAKRAVPRRALRCDADMLPTRVHACLDGSITSHMRLCDRCFCHKNNLHVQAGIADSLTPSSLFASIYVQKWLQASKQQSHDEHT